MVSLFDNPNSEEFLGKCFKLLRSETDRGCVLLGMSMLDEELKSLFEKILPEEISNKRKKELFNFSGTFGTISAKLDIAYVCNILPSDLVEAIHKLRKLRNTLAHKPAEFTMYDNLEIICEVFAAVEGNLAEGLLSLSTEFVYEGYIKSVLEADHPVDEGKKLFENRAEALSHLSDSDDLKGTLKDQKIKTMFIIGVSTLAALIIFHRDKAVAKQN